MTLTSSGSRAALRALLVLIATALGAAAATPAAANQVVRDEVVGCSLDCQDSFEIKCTQKSSLLCATVEGDSSDQFLQFDATAVGLAPSAMLGVAQSVLTGPTAARTICLARPGGAGTMKALLQVNALGGQSNRAYDLRAECKLGLFESKNTVVTRKQNE